MLSPRFVAAYIAPRLVQQVRSPRPAVASSKGKVRNPDYERWAGFGVGSYTIMEGYQEYTGTRTPLRLKVMLKSKSADRLYLILWLGLILAGWGYVGVIVRRVFMFRRWLCGGLCTLLSLLLKPLGVEVPNLIIQV